MMEKQYKTEEEKKKRRVMWFSIVLHLAVILLLFLPWFNVEAKDSLDDPPGILVHFSFDEGASSPKSEPTKPAETPAEKPEVKPDAEVKKPIKKPVEKDPVKIQSKDVVDESAIVASKAKADKLKRDKEAEAAAKRAKAAEDARKAKAAKEAAEKKAAEAAEAKKQAEYDASKSKFSDLFGSGSASQNTGTSASGNPDGDPDSSKLDGLTSGKGTVGSGLGGRGILFEPTIKDNSQKSGKVVIRVCVGPEGNVISKKFTQSGSTTTDSYLVELALKNVSKYKFTESEIQEQCGDILIDFKLK